MTTTSVAYLLLVLIYFLPRSSNDETCAPSDDLLVTQRSEAENMKQASNFNNFNEASNVIGSYEKIFSSVVED